jgi:thioredoxin 1
MLRTNLKHLMTENQIDDVLKKSKNVVVVCGRMGAMCIPVYAAMDQLKNKYPQVDFCDIEFDIPAAGVIKNLPECSRFNGLPFTVYYKGSKVVAATTSLQTRDQITQILDKVFSPVSDPAI